MSQRITIDPITRIEGIYASTVKSITEKSLKLGLPVLCGVEWRRS